VADAGERLEELEVFTFTKSNFILSVFVPLQSVMVSCSLQPFRLLPASESVCHRENATMTHQSQVPRRAVRRWTWTAWRTSRKFGLITSQLPSKQLFFDQSSF
jgi:hypothetical protein